MTTVFVTQPETDVNLFELMEGVDQPRRRGLPLRRGLPARGDRRESNQREGAVAMVSSQDAAVAVALTELGYDVDRGDQGRRGRSQDAPADGRLKAGDVILAVDGKPVDDHRPGRRGGRPPAPAGADARARSVRDGDRAHGRP